MTDKEMIEYLRRHAHWTTEQPWKNIADRFEQLSEKEKQNG